MRKPYVHVDRRRQGNTHGGIIPRVVVLHSTESHDRPGKADVDGVLRYLEQTPDKLGIHFVVDKTGKVGQGANPNLMCYHAAGANGYSVGIEMIGFARFAPRTWMLRRAQRRKVARLLAWLHVRYGVPLRRSTTNGVATHADFPEGGHWDPGRFPVAATLRLARKIVAEES